jgi:hypothetical protein
MQKIMVTMVGDSGTELAPALPHCPLARPDKFSVPAPAPMSFFAPTLQSGSLSSQAIIDTSPGPATCLRVAVKAQTAPSG